MATWEVSGGIVSSARTDSEPGHGWVFAVGRRWPTDDWLFGGVSFQGELSTLTDADGMSVTRFVFGVDLRKDWFRYGGGYAFCGGDDVWGAGLQFMAGIGATAGRGELRLATCGYVWLGGRNNEFDVDVEIDVRFIAGLRF